MNSVSAANPIANRTAQIHNVPLNQGHERTVGRYDFEGGQYVRIMASKDIDTEEALDMVETMLTLKRKELARRKRGSNAVQSDIDATDKNETLPYVDIV